MLPRFGSKLGGGLPRRLTFVRDLEEFEGGAILSEYKATGGAIYVEKFCARDGTDARFMIVRSDQRSVAEFLAGKVTMLALLKEYSDGIGFLIDRCNGDDVAAYIAPLADLPKSYFPIPTRYHDETLRPHWDVVPESYLLDDEWDAKTFAVIERHYLNAAAFAYHTKPGTNRRFPTGVLRIDFDGGYSVMHAFNAIRETVPPDAQSRSGQISASSPGVLTIDSPAETADRLLTGLRALTRSAVLYRAVHEWSRLSPDNAKDVPTVARENVEKLCAALDVDPAKLYPDHYDANREKDVVLVAGKLIAAYYRVLLRVVHPVQGAEFTGAKIEEAPLRAIEVQEDEEEMIEVRGRRR